ncbi:permease [Rhodopseudomonas boonkerdii]|uniref:permease n=1 Tax=Rhodopseudomonas boonkerdii TaxID=475937 RepID=UPI001E5B58C1|nr:permease [Rhodopseudomonas boonkerdii]UGV27718.1 permease [Rhodopseudomonas boonkerdii]
MSAAVSALWFARHELRLGWRETVSMLTGGRRRRTRSMAFWLIVLAIFLHLPAYGVVGRFADVQTPLDQQSAIVITASVFLAWALILSQAIESVTRVFYARADLDLIVSSPAPLTNVFSVRIAAIALSVTVMAIMLATPFINVLVIGGGARWFAAYGVVVTMGLSASAVAIAVAVGLFELCGPSRTRMVAQIISAVTGAGFVIALQVAAILSYGTLSRFAVLTSDAAAAIAPDAGSVVWWPARAMLGDVALLLPLLASGLLLLGVTMALFSPHFSRYVASASPQLASRNRGALRPFRTMSRRHALRRKEFKLLWRDPWLMSQTLMQLLYLLPPALMLWRSFGEGAGAFVVLVPVIVMAAGQLAGGLAWLTISGEDAADLVATAPLPAAKLLGAKIEVVLICIAAIFTPLIAALALVSWHMALVAALATVVAAASATSIQLWFRVQAKRSQFRRRQTSSRIATFAEAFSSIGWAATAVLTLLVPIAGAISGLLTVGIVALAWKLSPSRA